MSGSAPKPFSNAFRGASTNSLRYNTSQKGSPVYVVYGTERCSVNMIAGSNFQQHGTSSGKGGKGGSKSSKKGGPQYSVDVDFALCEGPVSFTGSSRGDDATGSNQIWSDGGVANVLSAGLNLYTGEDGQDPDPVFATLGDLPILGYSGTAHVTATPMNLGSTPMVPNIQIEIRGFGAGTAGTSFPDDARPDYIVVDMLTDSRHGAGFPLANLDTGGSFGGGGSVADWGNYCQGAQFAMSIVIDRQQPAARWLDEIANLTVSAVVWSPPLLKIIPYADGGVSANGSTWNPDLTWRYSLGDDDFLPWQTSQGNGSQNEQDPVIITRSDPTGTTNWMTVEYDDPIYNYDTESVPVWDQGSIDLYGLHSEPAVLGDFFANTTSASLSAQTQIQRKQYIRNTYKFKLSQRYCLLEPMDIVLLTDTNTGLEGAAARILQIDEDDNGELTISAEEIPGIGGPPSGSTINPIGAGVATFISTGVTAAPPVYDPGISPGFTNPPIIFDPPAALTAGTSELWIVATGGPEWGGCAIYVSTDNETYAPAGQIYQGGRQGVLMAALPTGSDPDTVNTLSVDLAESDGTMTSGSQSDADNLVTLCYCDGELISYETAALVGANEYNLTYLRRGAYGTTIGSHNIGTQFAPLGHVNPALFQWQYPSSFAGQTIYFKFPAFNLFFGNLQDLADVPYYTYSLGSNGGVGIEGLPLRPAITRAPLRLVTIETAAEERFRIRGMR